jgi:cardiolipin synthase
MMLTLHTAYELLDTWFMLVLSVGCALFASVHAVLTKPDPRSAFGWIAMCWLFPLGGAILYGFFGINRVRESARQLRGGLGNPRNPVRIPGENAPADHLMRIGDAVTQWARIPGNSIESLENGENAFPAMLAAIAGARRTVWLATYIFETDPVGQEFIKALAAAAARGVQVRVLVDGVGEWYSWPHVVPELRRAGVVAQRFLPPRLFPPRLSINMRNHRKLLLVDGETGFLGGMNIGGREVGKTGARRMADLHFKVCGPVLRELGESFGVDWRFAAKETLVVPDAPPARGECLCRLITEGPDEDNDKLVSVMMGAVSMAREQLLIMTPYFIPPPELSSALQSAALRGVDVTLVLPERSNLRYVDWACRRWLKPLIERGVRVCLQAPPFAHTKLLVMDGSYAQIGSANLDPRSLRLNFEIALEVYDSATCQWLSRYILEARNRSTVLTAEALSSLSGAVRLRDSLCWLMSPYL